MLKSRRTFLAHSAFAVGALSVGLPALADPLDRRPRHRPVGIQLYSLGDAVATDTARVLAQLKSFGYEELEAVTYDTLSPSELRRQVNDAGLRLRSVHLEFSGERDVAKLFETAHQLGVEHVVSSVLSPSSSIDSGAYVPMTGSLTIDDFKKIADRANHIGEQAKRAGFQYAYHNHNFEFRKLGYGKIGYDILLRETDPRLVKFEADCGWMTAAGADPVAYLRHNPGRYRAIHVKDFDKANFTTTLDETALSHVAELGRGVVDYPPILRAAEQSGVQYLFVEHDPPGGVPIPMDEVEREGRYLRSLLG